MGQLSKPLRCQIPAEPLTIAPRGLDCFPHTEKSEKRKAKYQSPRLAVCSQINGKCSLLLHPHQHSSPIQEI